MHYDTVGNLYLIEMPPVTDPDTGEIRSLTASNHVNVDGQVDATTDLRGHVTRYTYYPDSHASAGQKWTECSAESGTVTFTYDANNNVKTETRQRTDNGAVRNEAVTYDYDGKNRLTKTTYPDSTYTETRYTPQGWVQYEWDAKRNLTEYEYDLAGKREAVIRYLDGRAIRHDYTYYPNGELHTETDAPDHTTTYNINAQDQRIETQFHNNTVIQHRIRLRRSGQQTHPDRCQRPQHRYPL